MIAPWKLYASLVGMVAGVSARPARDGGSAPIPPVRQLGQRIAVSADSFGIWSYVRPLNSGRVLVNDIGQHRIVLLDGTLIHETIAVASTDPGGSFIAADDHYHAMAGIVPATGDSTVFVDGAFGHLNLTMIDRSGHLGDVIAMPHPSALASLIVARGLAVFDSAGRATYRLLPGSMGGVTGMRTTPQLPSPPNTTRDTTLIVRALPKSHALDTVGLITAPHVEADIVGAFLLGPRSDNIHTINPIGRADDAVIFPDGAVAFIRGADYHIDWVEADGMRRSTPQIPHEWHRLTAAEKVAIVDSTRAWAAAHPHLAASGPIGVRPVTRWVPDTVISPSALADTLPPFLPGARADAEGRLWIPQGLHADAKADGGPLYDVVDHAGQLIDRVQLPHGTTLLGFGPGTAYLLQPAGGHASLASYRIR